MVDSVTKEKYYDFLYSDHERVASILSQLTGSGSPTLNSQTRARSKDEHSSVGAKIPIINAEMRAGREDNFESRQEFDPLWSNSQELVSRFTVEDTADTSSDPEVGQLVVISGTLLCMDQSVVNALLTSPAINGLISAGVDDDPDDAARSSKHKKTARDEKAQIIREFLNALPLGVVFTLVTEREAFWFNVRREYLQLQSLDIPMKFPTHTSGTWHALGIVDACPGDYVPNLDSLSSFDDKQIIPGCFEMIGRLTVPLLALFGRPAGSYGLSPLCIYREIRADSVQSGSYPHELK